jgi:lipopolysaccharide/colanic/teichoic acid biosynthesis glycosyltransferase
MTKRCFDVLVALCALLVTWPLIAIGALMVKLTSPGPAFYRSKRAGFGGKPFEMLKLRTMHLGPDSPDRRVTEVQDARITRIGKLLRHTKLDEMPQLWNVLRGDMSIVGPRPEDWDIVQRYFSPAQRHMLDVRPGIASPVDVNWYPDLTYYDPPPRGVPIQDHYVKRHMPIQVAEGIRYVERHNLLLDLAVIARLVYCVTIYSWRAPARERPLPAES